MSGLPLCYALKLRRLRKKPVLIDSRGPKSQRLFRKKSVYIRILTASDLKDVRFFANDLEEKLPSKNIFTHCC